MSDYTEKMRIKAERQRRVWNVLNDGRLKAVCEMHESEFEAAYDLRRVEIPQRGDSEANHYLLRDTGAPILAVAHLDTVVDHWKRIAQFLTTADDETIVFSGALDDRLGAYVLLEVLPALGINHDILLTVGEESGRSTAEFFDPPRDYNWMIEFDRGGTDVVMYQYDDSETRGLVRDAGAVPGNGSFSDIAYLEHLEVKGFNWGVGYQGDYHSTEGHAWLSDTVKMVGQYLLFHEQNADEYLPHEETRSWLVGAGRSSGYSSYWWEQDDIEERARLNAKFEEWAAQGEEPDYSENPTLAEINEVLGIEDADEGEEIPVAPPMKALPSRSEVTDA